MAPPRKRSFSKRLSAPRKHSVLIVDAHPLTTAGVARAINLQPDLQVAGVAEDVEDAQQLLKTQRPDVVIIDPDVTEGEVGAVLSKVRIGTFQPPLVVHSMHATYTYLLACLKAGAKGFLAKGSAEELLTALRQVLAGTSYLPIPHRPEPPWHLPSSPIPPFSHQDFAIFERLGRGLKPAAIASDLRVNPRTVAVHCTNMRTKLKLPDFAALKAHAVHWVKANKTGSV